jgi:hexokinase
MSLEYFEELEKLYPLITEDELPLLARKFQHELIAALSNQPSSLPSILNPVHKFIPTEGEGVAISVGGTNGYVSKFKINGNKIVRFSTRKTFSLPEETTRDSLFHLLAGEIFKVSDFKINPLPIGIGFAYPLKPMLHHKYIDGELLYMTKGRQIEGLVGKKVGQEFHRFLIEKYGIDTTVTVANDAICLLLGANGAEVAGVVGTGLNFAYWEERTAIAPLKLSQLYNFVQREIAINIESKNFDKIPATRLRTIIDKESSDPNFSLAEKEASGAYLYKIFNAGKDKIIGKNFPKLSSTDQLNDILTKAFVYPTDISDSQKLAAMEFADRIFHRSAQIVAIETCGILQKLGKTLGIVPIVMEGGIFWKAHNYPTLVNTYINCILPQVIPSFARIFGSSRKGIAILARVPQN